jgi:hypothetical protein
MTYRDSEGGKLRNTSHNVRLRGTSLQRTNEEQVERIQLNDIPLECWGRSEEALYR